MFVNLFLLKKRTGLQIAHKNLFVTHFLLLNRAFSLAFPETRLVILWMNYVSH